MNKLIIGEVKISHLVNDEEQELVKTHNMITVGLGYSIANLMTAAEDGNINDYVMGYMSFGFGSMPSSLSPEVSSFVYELALPVNLRFLNNNILEESEYLNYLKGTTYTSGQEIELTETKLPFLKLPKSRITSISNNAVKHTLILDDSYDFEYLIKELGLFIRNPRLSFKGNAPLLGAYKNLSTPITKPIGVKLKIDWTIRFNI